MAVGTCRMAHLALRNSELHVGVGFDEHPRIQAIARGELGRAAVLFPGPQARDVRTLEAPPECLVVVDGTWVNARKLVERNAVLRQLPRVAFSPRRPGNYRIRREPAEHCVSTVEAVVEVLEALERAPGQFEPMLRAFDRMVEHQLDFIARRAGPGRHKRLRHRAAQRDATREELSRRWSDVVVFYGEANAYSADSGMPGAAELLQLCAARPATGERFEAFLAPRRPLAPHAPHHLEVPAARLEAGEPVSAVLERWRRFTGPDAIGLGWGHYALDLLRAEGGAFERFVDLRQLTARALKGRPGASERAVDKLGATLPPSWAAGRAGRRLAALEAIAKALISSAGA